MTWARLAIVGALTALLVVGCGRRGDRDDAPSRAVDVELLAFLSEARALHHRANVDEQTGALGGAADAMDRLVRARRPYEGATTPEVEEVLADAYARLAELRLRQGAVDLASEAVAAGLAHAPDPTYFRGHLIEVDGLVLEARAASLEAAARPEEAARAREQAIARLEEAVRIQDLVIRRASAAREAGAPPR